MDTITLHSNGSTLGWLAQVIAQETILTTTGSPLFPTVYVVPPGDDRYSAEVLVAKAGNGYYVDGSVEPLKSVQLDPTRPRLGHITDGVYQAADTGFSQALWLVRTVWADRDPFGYVDITLTPSPYGVRMGFFVAGDEVTAVLLKRNIRQPIPFERGVLALDEPVGEPSTMKPEEIDLDSPLMEDLVQQVIARVDRQRQVGYRSVDSEGWLTALRHECFCKWVTIRGAITDRIAAEWVRRAAAPTDDRFLSDLAQSIWDEYNPDTSDPGCGGVRTTPPCPYRKDMELLVDRIDQAGYEHMVSAVRSTSLPDPWEWL